LQNATDLIPENYNDYEGCDSRNPLHHPAGYNQSQRKGDPLKEQENCNPSDYPEYICTSKKDIKAKEDIAVQYNVNDVLPTNG